MSDVYLASVGTVRQNTNGKGPLTTRMQSTNLVVLKVSRITDELQDFYRQSMDNEVERLRRLKHPGIVRIFPIQFGGDIPNLAYTAEATGLPGRPWFSVLEYLSGGALTEIIEEGNLSIGMALEFARSLAATLDYLHGRGMVHLDIKPENVLLRTKPVSGEPTEPVLIDFGIARDIGQTGLEARTLHYAAPERVQLVRQAEKPLEMLARPHPTMDIYALGVVLYEMLTGKLPFTSRSQSSLTSEIMRGNPTPPSKHRRQINDDLDDVVLRMLDKDADRRPTAEQTAILLEEVAIKGRYLPRYPSRQGRAVNVAPVQPRRTRSGRLIAGVLVAVAALQLFLIAGTARYWPADIRLNSTGIGTITSNVGTLLAAGVDAAGTTLLNRVLGRDATGPNGDSALDATEQANGERLPINVLPSPTPTVSPIPSATATRAPTSTPAPTPTPRPSTRTPAVPQPAES